VISVHQAMVDGHADVWWQVPLGGKDAGLDCSRYLHPGDASQTSERPRQDFRVPLSGSVSGRRGQRLPAAAPPPMFAPCSASTRRQPRLSVGCSRKAASCPSWLSSGAISRGVRTTRPPGFARVLRPEKAAAYNSRRGVAGGAGIPDRDRGNRGAVVGFATRRGRSERGPPFVSSQAAGRGVVTSER
jgi:hypothetical protein